MRVGLLGLGRIGGMHARHLTSTPGVDELVVCDALPEATERVAQELDVRGAPSPAALMDAVDAVVVAAATDAHPALVLEAVRRGLPVFCEKPVARTLEEHAQVLAAVEGTDVPVQVGYPRRFDAGYTAARSAVRSAELGWLHTVRATTLDPAPPPAAYVAISGGIFRDCSVHDLDAVRWVTGREVTQVYATGSNRGDALFAELGDVDTAAIVLTLDDGTLALVSNSRYNARGHDVRLEVHGSKDSVAVGLEDRLPLRSVEPGVNFPAGVPYDFFRDRFAAAFRAEMGAFLQVAAGSRPSPCDVADALETARVAEACVLSLQQRRPVPLTDVPLS